MTEITTVTAENAESTEPSVATDLNFRDSIEPEARRIRITIPPNQCVFIEQQAQSRSLEFNDVVYELIRDRIGELTAPTQDPVEAMSEAMSKAMERLETHFDDHLAEIKKALQSLGNQNCLTRTNDAETSEEDEGNLARLMTAILQGHLQPPLHRLIAQIETFQTEVRDANHALCDRDQSRGRGELDRWFVAKAELEVLREMLIRVVIAATPPEHRAEFVEYTAYVAERFRQFETRLPPLPDYFLPSSEET